MMKPTRKVFLYGIYAIMAMCVFLYLRFPSALMKELLTTRLEKIYPEVRVDTDEVTATIPPGIKLSPLLLSHAQEPVLRMDDLKVRPHLFSLFSQNKVFSLQGAMGEGELNGRAEIVSESNTQQPQINLNLSRVPLTFFEILDQFQNVKTDGEMDAKINFDGKKAGGTADVQMEISPAQIILDPPVMGLEVLAFSSIKAQLTVSRRMMQIRNCDAFGDQLEGKITGSIVFRQPFEESRMTLALTFKPQPAFLADHKNDMLGGLLASENAQRRGLVFRISGTFKNPNYVIR